MQEREPQTDRKSEKLKNFAAQLASWDRDIVAISTIPGSEIEDSTAQVNKIELICTFDPEPIGDNQGYMRVINLLLRDDYEQASQRLGLDLSIELGFVMGDKVFLSDGSILDDFGEQIPLWPEIEERNEYE